MKECSAKNTTWVECGRVGRPIGLRGDVSVIWNNGDCPVEVGGEIFAAAKNSTTYDSYRIAAQQMRGRFSVVRFEGIEDRNSAAQLTNKTLYIPEESLGRLPEGEYYCYQILGLDVVLEDGSLLGKIVRIFTAGENDVYEVRKDGAEPGDEILIPAIDSVVLSIDIAGRKVVVRPLEGMLD